MKKPKHIIAILSQRQPSISTFFLPYFVKRLLKRGANTHMEIEYPEKMNPKVDVGTPLLAASAGKNGAIELYAELAVKLTKLNTVIMIILVLSFFFPIGGLNDISPS